MKNKPPFTILRVSLAAAGSSVLCTAFVIVVDNLYFRASYIVLAVSILVVFLVNLGLFYALVNHFVYDKIKPIYRYIHTKRQTREVLFPQLGKKKDMIESVQHEVSEWLDKRDQELDRMKEQEAFRREFIGNVSHELKTPIFNIQGYITTLLDGGLEDPEINIKYLERSVASIDRMIAIVNDLEVLSRLETKQNPLKLQTCDLSRLITDVVDSHELEANKLKHRIEVSIQSRYSPEAVCDREKIRQVLSNLITNSMRYRKPDGSHTKINVFDMHDKYLIEIADNGIGIAEKDLPRIFERFYRTDKARTREHGGSGIGLAIVKHIIEAHHQSITVKSKIGEGTTFSFTLDKAV